MFSKIYVLSVFVVCLFNLGQAAPVIDEMSSLSTREASSLVTRGFFDNLFGHKLDAVTKKQVDNATISALCQMHTIDVMSLKAYEDAEKSLKLEMDAVNKKKVKKDVGNKYKESIKKFKGLAKDSGKKVKQHVAQLKKLGSDVAHCTPPASTSDHVNAASSHHSHASHHFASHHADVASPPDAPSPNPDTSSPEKSD